MCIRDRCVYWIANAAFSCIPEQVLNKHFSKVLDREETNKERQKREARYAKMQAARENYNRSMRTPKPSRLWPWWVRMKCMKVR